MVYNLGGSADAWSGASDSEAEYHSREKVVQQRKLTSGKREEIGREIRGGGRGRGGKLRKKEKSLWARSSVASLLLVGTISL